MNTLGERIRQARTKKNLTQAQLADMLGKAESSIRMWELGKSQPDSYTLSKISKIFNVTTDYFLGEVNEPFPLNEETEVLILRRETGKMNTSQRKEVMNLLKEAFNDFDWED